MKGYDYYISDEKVKLFHVTKRAKEELKKYPSWEELSYQRCTDQLNAEDFKKFQEAMA